MSYQCLEVRAGPEKTSMIVAVGFDRSETVIDAGVTGAFARTRIREIAAAMRVPIKDCTTPSIERKWLGHKMRAVTA